MIETFLDRRPIADHPDFQLAIPRHRLLWLEGDEPGRNHAGHVPSLSSTWGTVLAADRTENQAASMRTRSASAMCSQVYARHESETSRKAAK